MCHPLEGTRGAPQCVARVFGKSNTYTLTLKYLHAWMLWTVHWLSLHLTLALAVGFPVELLPGAVLDPSRDKTARIDFSKQVQRLKNAKSIIQARIP